MNFFLITSLYLVCYLLLKPHQESKEVTIRLKMIDLQPFFDDLASSELYHERKSSLPDLQSHGLMEKPKNPSWSEEKLSESGARHIILTIWPRKKKKNSTKREILPQIWCLVNTGSITPIGSTRTRTQTTNDNYFRRLRNYLESTNSLYYLLTLISARWLRTLLNSLQQKLSTSDLQLTLSNPHRTSSKPIHRLQYNSLSSASYLAMTSLVSWNRHRLKRVKQIQFHPYWSNLPSTFLLRFWKSLSTPHSLLVTSIHHGNVPLFVQS